MIARVLRIAGLVAGSIAMVGFGLCGGLGLVGGLIAIWQPTDHGMSSVLLGAGSAGVGIALVAWFVVRALWRGRNKSREKA